MDKNGESRCLFELKSKINSISPIGQESWLEIKSIITFEALKKKQILLRSGKTARTFHFICNGIVRAYIVDSKGGIYNKNILFSKEFCGSISSLIQCCPSKFTFEALEDTFLITMDFNSFRKLTDDNSDLKNFYIAYLEKYWVIEKEKKELSLVMDNAMVRYIKLLREYPSINNRVPQLHIAAHLGITPTQLSRIRKKLQNDY